MNSFLLDHRELAIDLGTASTRLHTSDRNDPLVRPSVVWRTGGERAALRKGVIVDPDAATYVLTDLLRQVTNSGWRKPRAVACVPTDADEEERALVTEAIRRAGVRSVAIVSEPLAAAFGAGLPLSGSDQAHALVDIGEGVTDCAVVRGGRIERAAALRVAVSDLRAAVQDWAHDCLDLHVSSREAARVLRESGVAPTRHALQQMDIVGSPLRGAGPVSTRFEVGVLHAALEPVADQIAVHIEHFVTHLPPELAARVAETGVCLTGGGALLHGIVDRLVSEMRLSVWRSPDPLNSVIEGARLLASSGLVADA